MSHHLEVPHVSPEMHQCIDNCSDCFDVCTATLTYCIEQGHTDATHVLAMRDCAAACQASLGFMLRGSDLHHAYCDACAQACERCAESCEAFGDDEVMRRCAETCRHCAETCRAMASQRH
jgi:hypothetical protein